MNNNPEEKGGKPFPPWVNWFLVALLMLALILMIHDNFGTGVTTPVLRQKTNTAPVVVSKMKQVTPIPQPMVSNIPELVEFVSHRTRYAAEDDRNVTEIIFENTNWASVADGGVTVCVVDVYFSSEQATNTQVISVTARQRGLVELARKTFTRKNDPAYENDKDLTEVANAVAWFYLRYPSKSDCEHFADVCKQLEKSERYTEPLGGAIEGSRYIFENETNMMDRGFYRYGRFWVDSNGLARISSFMAEREKKIEDDLAKQRQEPSKSSDKSPSRKAPSAALAPHELHFKGPSYPIKRIGDRSTGNSNQGSGLLRGPDYPIRRIGAE